MFCRFAGCLVGATNMRRQQSDECAAKCESNEALAPSGTGKKKWLKTFVLASCLFAVLFIIFVRPRPMKAFGLN